MITNLLGNLSNIHNEIMTKLIPNNIRENITILNVTGTMQEGDPRVVYFSSVEEMNQHTDLTPGMYSVVANTNFEGAYRLMNNSWIEVGDPVDELTAFTDLSEVIGGEEPEYEGMGGTESEIIEILEDVLGEESPQPTPTEVVLNKGDSISINFANLATLIDENTTSEEKNEYLNSYSSEYSPLLLLVPGIFTEDSTEISCNICICQDEYDGKLYLWYANEDDNISYSTWSNPIIDEESSIPLKVSDLIGIFNDAGTITDNIMMGPSQDNTFECTLPTTSITLKGPNIDKTISTSGYSIIEVNS